MDPFAYLDDVLLRLPSLPAGRLEELLPDIWFKSCPAGRRREAR
ncbi:MAG: transposase domain-containing protein [Acidimicrobiales bacterium]